jgi:hypothetical protein
MIRAALLTPRIERGAALLALALLPACAETAGPDEPGTPTASSILVTTKTTGESIDADGYTVRLGARTVEIAVNGSARFDSVAPGMH